MWKHYLKLMQEQKLAVASASQALFTSLGSFFTIITLPATLQFVSAGIGIVGGALLARKSYYDIKKVRLEIEKLLEEKEDE